jgi:hypothetical protein
MKLFIYRLLQLIVGILVLLWGWDFYQVALLSSAQSSAGMYDFQTHAGKLHFLIIAIQFVIAFFFIVSLLYLIWVSPEEWRFLSYVFILVSFSSISLLLVRAYDKPDWNKIKESAMSAFPSGKDWRVPSLSETTPSAPPTNSPPPPPKPPEYIYANTTAHLDPSHVHDVAQPTQAQANAGTPKVFTPPDPLPAQPSWTWRTPDGKAYYDVVIDKLEADRVTIVYDGGRAIIDISLLPSDIQSQLNYDPELAAKAKAERQNDSTVTVPGTP